MGRVSICSSHHDQALTTRTVGSTPKRLRPGDIVIMDNLGSHKSRQHDSRSVAHAMRRHWRGDHRARRTNRSIFRAATDTASTIAILPMPASSRLRTPPRRTKARMVFSSNSRSRGLITSAMIASRARLHCPVRVYRRTPPEGASNSKVRRNRVAVAVIRWGPNTSSAKLRRCARCSACGNKGATIQHPGWGGNDVGFLPFPVEELGAHRAFATELALQEYRLGSVDIRFDRSRLGRSVD